MPDASDSSSGRAGKRAFWIAFGLSAVIPILMPLMVRVTETYSGAGLSAVILGSAVALFLDLALLLIGVVFVFNVARRPQGIGLLLGMLAGAIVGFGVCMVPLGM